MDDRVGNDKYPAPRLGEGIRPVINRASLDEEGGLYLTVGTSTLSWGDRVELLLDGETVSEGYVGPITYVLDFPVAPRLLQRHPGMDQPGMAIDASYIVHKYGATADAAEPTSFPLTLDAKTTLPGGGALAPIEGAEALAKGQDLVLFVPPWTNMEPGAALTVSWGQKIYAVDPASVVVGQPVVVTIPWADIDAAPQGIVTVTYEIEDRVGNRSGEAPPVEVTAVFADLLPMPTFQFAVNAKGQVDGDLATKLAAASDDPDSTPVVVEYPGVRSGDQIVLRLLGTPASGMEGLSFELMQFAGPLPADDVGSAPAEDATPAARYVFMVPIAWLSYLSGGRVFSSYTVTRAGVELPSATRERPVVGALLATPAPDIVQAPGDDALLDLDILTGDLQVEVEIFPFWDKVLMSATLRVRSGDASKAFERTLSLLETDEEDGFLTWTLSSDELTDWPEGNVVLSVVLRDAAGVEGPPSRSRRKLLRARRPAATWPPLVVDVVDGDQLAVDEGASAPVPVRLFPNALFLPGDQVTLNWQGTAVGPLEVDPAVGGLTFDVPRSLVDSLAGTTVSVSYLVSRGGDPVVPGPTNSLSLRIPSRTIGDLPPPVVTGELKGELDVDVAKDGVLVAVPGSVEVREGDTVVFAIRATGGEWRNIASDTNDAKVARIRPDDLIASLSNVLAVRYTLTRAGQSKASEERTLLLKAYAKEDPRLPKPLIREAQAKPGGIGNPYLDMKSLTADTFTIVVPPWPFMRAGQWVTITVSSVDKSGSGRTATFTLEKLPVFDIDLVEGITASIRTSWLTDNLPRVADTDLRIHVTIARPQAAADARYMMLPVAIVNVVNLDEVGTGTGATPPEGGGDGALPASPTVTVQDGKWIGNTYGIEASGMQSPVLVFLQPWKGMAVGDIVTLVARSPNGEPDFGIVRDYKLAARDLGGPVTFSLSRAWVNRVIDRRKDRNERISFMIELTGSRSLKLRVELFGTRFYSVAPEDLIDGGSGGGGGGGGTGTGGGGGSGTGTGGGGGSGTGTGGNGGGGGGGSGNGGNGSGGGGGNGGGTGGGGSGAGNTWPGTLDLVTFLTTGAMDFGAEPRSLLRNASLGPAFARGQVLPLQRGEMHAAYRYTPGVGILLSLDVLVSPGRPYWIGCVIEGRSAFSVVVRADEFIAPLELKRLRLSPSRNRSIYPHYEGMFIARAARLRLDFEIRAGLRIKEPVLVRGITVAHRSVAADAWPDQDAIKIFDDPGDFF